MRSVWSGEVRLSGLVRSSHFRSGLGQIDQVRSGRSGQPGQVNQFGQVGQARSGQSVPSD